MDKNSHLLNGKVWGPVVDYVEFNPEVLLHCNESLFSMEQFVPAEFLLAFVVCDMEVIPILRNLLLSFGLSSSSISIICQPYATQKYDIQPKYQLGNIMSFVLDQLVVVAEPVVFNCIVDQLKLDQIFLCHESTQFLFDQLVVESLEPDDKIISALDGDIIYLEDGRIVQEIFGGDWVDKDYFPRWSKMVFCGDIVAEVEPKVQLEAIETMNILVRFCSRVKSNLENSAENPVSNPYIILHWESILTCLWRDLRLSSRRRNDIFTLVTNSSSIG